MKTMCEYLARSGRLALLTATWLAALSPAFSQTNSIDWFTISGGGGVSTGGVYTLTSVIGQPAVAPLSGGNYQVQGGFLACIALVQTAGAPKLSLALTNGNAMISWPLPAVGYVLEQASALAGAQTQWRSVTTGYQTNATQIFVLQSVQPGNSFFRLKKP